ncbi:guanylate kinase [Sistotremastrum niveocremeum HHB9708]|uniref:Guanylate kinase n=2 Tax=Sistotremastraceae TaxID=3402574 RepID=A0A164RRD8_9AGAM|nr:guanylate kinase [Sistotremastrum niveocremeum HHB9708]KZT35870.1 guanylate kinase [Sistotremastrum suecicum HHB10207 ss-3]
MSPVTEFLRPLVLFGPSGSGKSTLVGKLLAEFPDKFGFSVSHTTRSPRAGEEDGKAYHFVTREKFLSLVAEGAFIEHAEFSKNLYGTTFQAVRHVADTGRRCILDIDSQGVRNIKKTDLNPTYIFISPPSVAALRQRLLGRGTETEDSIETRLKASVTELQYAREPGVIDLVVVNDDVERAYGLFKKIALGETTEGDLMPELDS